MEHQSLLTVILACMVVMSSHVTAYPHGAPAKACGTLNPSGHGPSTAKGPSPYKLTFSSDTYKPGQVITVTLTGALFKGFLIVGRKSGDTAMDNVGFFQKPSTPRAQLLCIDGKDGNGITHTNNTVKAAIELEWKAPTTSVGDIVFHYTVVRGGAPSVKMLGSDYFMNVTSSPLKAASGLDSLPSTDLRFDQEWKNVAVLQTLHDEEEGEIVYAVPSGAHNAH